MIRTWYTINITVLYVTNGRNDFVSLSDSPPVEKLEPLKDSTTFGARLFGGSPPLRGSHDSLPNSEIQFLSKILWASLIAGMFSSSCFHYICALSYNSTRNLHGLLQKISKDFHLSSFLPRSLDPRP